MNNHHDTEHLFVARCSLVLFIAGLLIPPMILALGADARDAAKQTAFFAAFGLGLLAGVLSLIFGTIGRRYLSGKIGMIGGIILLALALVVVALLVLPAGR
jgi:uncharacterized ion transporter superfamily protein YfcC